MLTINYDVDVTSSCAFVCMLPGLISTTSRTLDREKQEEHILEVSNTHTHSAESAVKTWVLSWYRMQPIKQPVNQPTTRRRSTIEPSNQPLVSSVQAPSPITYRLNTVRRLICAHTQTDVIDDADQSNWHISKHTFYLQLLRTHTYII